LSIGFVTIEDSRLKMPHNVRAWRCGGIPCYVSPDMLLIKDMKMKIYSIAGFYSSVGYVAEQ